MNAILVYAVVLIAATSPASAQQPAQQPPGAPQSGATVIRADEPALVFEREVFSYQAASRRDPFMPLTGRNAGPLFEELRLRIILFSDRPAESLVTLMDAANNTYRVRRGETVGNATVVDIGPTRVVFSVDDFGQRRQEVLELTATREGAGR